MSGLITYVMPLIATHGYWLVGVIVGVESMGIPAPGETALVTAAIYAGTTHRLSIVLLIVAATIGAIVGDNLGYLIGRRFGYEFLLRHGRRIGVDEARLKLGRSAIASGRCTACLRPSGLPSRSWLSRLSSGGCASTTRRCSGKRNEWL